MNDCPCHVVIIGIALTFLRFLFLCELRFSKSHKVISLLVEGLVFIVNIDDDRWISGKILLITDQIGHLNDFVELRISGIFNYFSLLIFFRHIPDLHIRV